MRGPQRVGIVGLGYVGVQLAVAFGRTMPTVGFDIDGARIEELQTGFDRTGEVTPEQVLSARWLRLTTDPADLRSLPVTIVAVPTPVDATRRPDLRALAAASEVVGQALQQSPSPSDDWLPIVTYESTVYPGCTEEFCVPILERVSGRRAGTDFRVGYSPERINPGDPEHTLASIVKVVAGQDEATTDALASLYGQVVTAGIYRAPDIRTAEAAKVIENVQRDLNIALMNELALFFHRLDLDTHEVLRAARTKWNFLPFEPGLVGGHCIPVDPYYLTYKAQEIGFLPEVILAGRRTNDSMGLYVARETVLLLILAGKAVRSSRVLVLGAAFKENVRDIRNTRVLDLVQELERHRVEVDVYDPLVEPARLRALGLRPVADPFGGPGEYDAMILAVPHRAFLDVAPERLAGLLRADAGRGVLVDVKGVLRNRRPTGDLLYWSL